MKESISAAASYVRMRAVAFGIKPPLFDNCDIHVHVPEGATPKDGPRRRRRHGHRDRLGDDRHSVRRDLAMTGEITLRGRVWPIVRSQGEAARGPSRGGIKTVLIPEENAKDLVEISESIKKGSRSFRSRAWTRCSPALCYAQARANRVGRGEGQADGDLGDHRAGGRDDSSVLTAH
jgi:ATP-dependent Lon protease